MVTMTVPDLRSLLARGNPTPAPGPDDWEKWALLRSGDEFLLVISTLVNYVTKSNYFPPEIKRNYVIPIYKRGDITEPSNYRGIVLANTFQSIVASWFTFHLSRYVWDMGMIPDTQIAAQRNTRVGDMTHLLSALDGFARHTDTNCFALKRDQSKGFDYVHKSAFRDATTFFGIPQAWAFDEARTDNVELAVKCRNSISSPLYTTGQTKQGDPFSPLKYVLTTAMAFWWINDRHSNIGYRIRTSRAPPTRGPNSTRALRWWETPHQTPEEESILIQSVAAMDDTILFSACERGLQLLTFDMEYFQVAYNMATNWAPDKTTLFHLGALARTKIGHPVTLPLPDGTQVTLRTSADRSFLRTPINDPAEQARHITHLVRTFNFPRPGRALPFTVLRRVAHSVLAARVSARLQLLPVSDHKAIALVSALNVKVMRYYNDILPGNAARLVAPLESGGLDFPDLRRTNAEWAIIALHRNLNSQNPTIRKAYRIMHAEMQCSSCSQREEATGRPTTKLKSHRCWPPLAPYGQSYTNSMAPYKTNFVVWEVARQYLIDIGCRIVPTPTLSTGKRKVHDARARDAAFWTTFDEDGVAIETLRRAMVAHRAPREARPMEWATDGSMANGCKKGRTRDRTVENTDGPDTTFAGPTFAVVGPANIGARLKGGDNIEEAEIMAIATAVTLDGLIRANTEKRLPDSIIYSDHLNTVRKFENHRTTTGHRMIRPGVNAGPALRYLAKALDSNPYVQLRYQKAHTDSNSRPAKLNRQADEAARRARSEPRTIGIPMSCADDFSFRVDDSGIHMGDIRDIVGRAMKKLRHDALPRPENVDKYFDAHLFTKASKGFAAKTQHLARNNTLPTAAWMMRRGLLPEGHERCFVCDAAADMADERHIFLTCDAAQAILREHEAEAEEYLSHALKKRPEALAHHKALLQALFHNDPLWESERCVYWKGQLPGRFKYDEGRTKMYNHLASITVRVTARIWGANIKGATNARRHRARQSTTAEARRANEEEDDDLEDNPSQTVIHALAGRERADGAPTIAEDDLDRAEVDPL